VSSIAHRSLIHLGMDVSKDAIALAVLPEGSNYSRRRCVGSVLQVDAMAE
jgi:hypothetical protein